MSFIDAQGIRKQFAEVTAVDGVDLSVQQGEFLVILGPSGCGKTTLMRMIAGLETPTSGHLYIDNEEVTHLPPRARQVAMVFQSYALYPHKTVFENIVFPLKAQKVPKEEWQSKVEEAANLLGLGRLLDRKPRQLSGGERQRVALARAMVRDPKVMLLDEPLSNLDAKLRAAARDELQRFQRRLGVTTIFVTHDQIEAMGMGDRIAVMYQGKIRQLGTPAEVYKNSADTFVASFLGSPGINFLERDTFTLGFRPENFLPKETLETRDDVVDFNFRVNRIEYLGADRLLFGNVEGAGEDMITISKLPSAVNISITPGDLYDFAVERHELRFFDRESGVRIEEQAL